jgi:hypothetical protein
MAENGSVPGNNQFERCSLSEAGLASNTEETLMLTQQMKDDLRKATWTWKKPAIHFTGLLGRTMESRLHYQPRLKVLNGFALLHSMRAVR